MIRAIDLRIALSEGQTVDSGIDKLEAFDIGNAGEEESSDQYKKEGHGFNSFSYGEALTKNSLDQ
jgi:hypothetical protein